MTINPETVYSYEVKCKVHCYINSEFASSVLKSWKWIGQSQIEFESIPGQLFG